MKRETSPKPEKTSLKDAVISGVGKMGDRWVSLAVMDFRFSRKYGICCGEKITRTIERGEEFSMFI